MDISTEELSLLLEEIRVFAEYSSEIDPDASYSDEDVFGQENDVANYEIDGDNQKLQELKAKVESMVECAMVFLEREHSGEGFSLEEILGTEKANKLKEFIYNTDLIKDSSRQSIELGQQDINDDKAKDSLENLSLKDLENLLKNTQENNLIKQKEIRTELINKIKQAQEESKALDAKLLEIRQAQKISDRGEIS